jgi:hypothetical protein
MSPMKKPKLSVHAKMMKNPKMTFEVHAAAPEDSDPAG